VLPFHDAAGVFAGAEQVFLFPLALRLFAPHRHRRAHEDRHHTQADQQRRHGIATVGAGAKPGCALTT